MKIKMSRIREIIKEEVQKKLDEEVWSPAIKKAVKKLDDEFTDFLVKKGVYPYSKEAADLWRSAGYQKRFKQIFGKNESINESLDGIPLTGYKRVNVRDHGFTSQSGLAYKGGDAIGWFANKHNPRGWAIFPLDSADKQFLGNKGKGVLRVATEKSTNLVKFDVKKGTYGFVDNNYLEKTDEIRFETMRPYKLIMIDEEQDIRYFI